METYMKNDQIANFHRIRYDVLSPEKNTLIISERERIFDNFVNNYNISENPLKEKILKEFKIVFQDRKMLIYALNNSQILNLFLKEIQNENLEIKKLSYIALENLLREEKPQKQFMQKNDLYLILKDTTHTNNIIKMCSLRIFYNLSKKEFFMQQLKELNVIEVLIELLSLEENSSLLVLINKTLGNFMCQENLSFYMQTLSLEDILKENCFLYSYGVMNESIFNLVQMNHFNKTRKIIIEKKIYQEIYKKFYELKIEKQNFDLKIDKFENFSPNKSFCEYFDKNQNECVNDYNFLNFFTFCCLEIEAKYFFEEQFAQQFVLHLLLQVQYDQESILAGIQFLTILGEHPKVRKYLIKNFEKIQKIKIDKENIEYLEELKKVIKWEPYQLIVQQKLNYHH